MTLPALAAERRRACSTALAARLRSYSWGDSDVISMLAGFRRHLVGKTAINVFHCDIAEMRFIDMIVIIQTFS